MIVQLQLHRWIVCRTTYYEVPRTHDGEVDGVGEGGAGVDLALVLPRVAPPHVRDHQLPLPRRQVLPHQHPGVLNTATIEYIFLISKYFFSFLFFSYKNMPLFLLSFLNPYIIR